MMVEVYTVVYRDQDIVPSLQETLKELSLTKRLSVGGHDKIALKKIKAKER